MAQDPYRYFRIEARELLEQLGKVTLELERAGGGADLVQRLLRLAHTLKGAARVVKQGEIADCAHAIEEALAPYRQTDGQVRREAIDAILGLVDGIAAGVSALSPAPRAESAAPVKTEEVLRMVRADVAEVDALLDGLAETHVQLSTIRKAMGQLERARHLGELLAEQLTAGAHREGASPRTGGAGKAFSMAEDLRALLGACEHTIGGAVDQMDRELRQVRDATEHLRLVPAGAVFTVLERAARDAAQSLGKEIRFEARGGDVRLDAHVLGIIQSALVQLIRNAIAHGIEPAAERRAEGKTPAGSVAVEIARRGRLVVFGCRDDGQGVDLDAVRRIAAQRGLFSAETQTLGPEELLRLLLRGGITTAREVTEVSGRGIGLDVVRAAIERLDGDIAVRTERGRGTAFELSVPLSLTSLEGLSVESAGIAATLPLDAVRRTMRVTAADVSKTAEGESLVFDGRVVPFVSLPAALRVNPPAAAARSGLAGAAVIVEAGGRMAALGVDRVLGTANVVLRPLPDLAPVDAIVAGASLDADGVPKMVLDPEGIIDVASRARNVSLALEPVQRPILVVDDSLTTRLLEQSILESAGYEVDVATSGEEALETVRRKPYALLLVDVEMPGMDGFTFIERVRADPELRDTPAILVTSRAAAEDRERGERVGAQGYIVKSEFDQSDLLARIERLVAG
ncbi:MAG: response regulator [Candidatus Binatia bacterium]